jgi:hypothetical protein
MMLILDWCLIEPRYGGCRELKTTGVALKLGTGMVLETRLRWYADGREMNAPWMNDEDERDRFQASDIRRPVRSMPELGV